MTRTWSLRLIAAGGLALALGCRTHPAVPVCTTPLYPEDVVKLSPAEKPALAASPAPVPSGALPPSPPAQAPESRPMPVADLGATPVGSGLASPPPAVNPLVVEDPRPKPGEDGIATGSLAPAGPPKPVLRLPDTKPAEDPALPLKPGEKLGHAADYHWVAGTLDRHLKGGYWTLRYADIGEDDPWGGKVRLLDTERLKGLRDGDTVYVEGDLLAPASAAETANYPPFRVTAVTVIDKAP